MAMQKFMDVAIGTTFRHEGNDYRKIPEERISCCSAINAQGINNNQQRIQVLPLVEVEVLGDTTQA